MQNNILHIFSNIIFSKGYCCTIIIDTQHKKTHSVPNSFTDFVNETENCSLEDIYQKFPHNKEIVDEYFDFITQNSIGVFLTKLEIENFAKMSHDYFSPYHFENAIVDVRNYSSNTEKIISKIDELNVGYIQVRFLEHCAQADLKKCLSLINHLSFEFCSFVLPYNPSLLSVGEDGVSTEEFANYPKLDSITIYNHPDDKIEHDYLKTIIYTSLKDIRKTGCGAVQKEYFSVDTKHILQSIHFNTCLYKKIYVSESGIIKNCPYSMLEYGNFLDLSNSEVLKITKNKKFTHLWHIKKDEIEVCKDCEFRLVCTDCRCFIKAPQNIHSQPSKCFYNPYIARWKGEEGYVSVEDCGSYSKESGFIPNHKKIAEINKQLWES
ncbi:MAG: grasp-with-spasm system SPASM domain peptide maturase [Bacteroidales bacterium]|nr:grasp-with-spasm system SPASM domain peptide maturase [Bacteroidales bacterium]